MKSPPITRAEEEARGKASGSISKGWFHGLIKVVTYFVIFIAGVVLGLSAGVHISRYFGSPTELFFPSTHYTASCKEEDYLKLDKYVNPGQLIHDMTDKELFWRASMIPKKMEYPYKRVQKVAFMFLTKGALPFQPLWDKFFNGHEGLYSIYVHAPPGYKLIVSESSAFYGRHIPSQKVKWGSVEMVDAERRLLANALLDFSNERFVLLSESCIPVYNFVTVYKYLTGSTHSFADSYDDPSRYGRGRYNRYMLPDIKLAHWRKGSQWFEINRFLALNMVADTKYYDLFRKYCKPSCYPDEHYLPTYLNMFFGSLNSNRSVTWVDWSKGGPHPAKFEGIDVTEEFIQAIRDGNGTTCEYNSKETTVCYLFARKFDASALGPLMNFTSTVMKF